MADRSWARAVRNPIAAPRYKAHATKETVRFAALPGGAASEGLRISRKHPAMTTPDEVAGHLGRDHAVSSNEV
jgi:hypothetical protein